MTYEMHDLGCMVGFAGNQVLVFGRIYLIRVFQKTSVVIMFVEYPRCVDQCEIYVIVLCWGLKKIE